MADPAVSFKDVSAGGNISVSVQGAGAARVEDIAQGRTPAQRRLERLVIDAAGGGKPVVAAIADIRDLFRPSNPDIDTIDAERIPGLVRRVLDELAKPAPAPSGAIDLPGIVRATIAESERLARDLRFADAAAGLDTLIRQRRAARHDEARADAALLAERARIARLSLRYREAAALHAEAAELLAFDAAASWAALIEAADVLSQHGDEFGDNEALREAIATYGGALAVAPRERVPLHWAMTQNNLGTALQTLGEREAGTARLEAAVAAYRAALEERTRERVPLDWAMTQNNLGRALDALGERNSGTARLEEAVVAYRAALEERTRERAPLDWAMTQSNLGTALRTLGAREAGTARLVEAVAAYRAALEERTRERVPLDWATTQNNLGNALQTLGAREAGTAQLEEAVAAYGAALNECTRERVPLDWAMTQNNLGAALWMLGVREAGTARLEEAVVVHRVALGEFTRDRAPLQWAATQNNLGIALACIGARGGVSRGLRKPSPPTAPR